MSVGVVGPSHWSYMAKEFARILGDILSSGRIEADSVPNSLYADASEFFGLLEQYVSAGVPPNPPASANAYMIAKRAMQTAVAKSNHGADVRKSLRECVRFFRSTRNPRELNGEEIAVATSLQEFLQQLYLDGQSDTYESRVHFKQCLMHS